jgi:hypothetical protein
MAVSSAGDLAVQVVADTADDAAALEELTFLLRDDLLELDIDSAELDETEAPADAKGLAAAGSWLVVHLGPAALREVVRTISRWAARTERNVELSLGGDTLKLTGATPQQMERALDEWFARHPARA